MNRILLIIAIGFFGFSFLQANEIAADSRIASLKKEHSWEEFDPTLLHKLQSIDDLIACADKLSPGDRKSLQYVNTIDLLIKKRFYHGYSRYSIDNNWIAALAGRMFWPHLAAIVNPDQIMKYPKAACSQQSMVFMESCKRIGIDYRSIGFAHHYGLEARIDGKWYYFDTNMEVTSKGRTSIENLQKEERLFSLYDKKLTPAQFSHVLANPTYGVINEEPAPQALLFHTITSILSETFIWGMFMIQLILLRIYYVNGKKVSGKL